MAQKRPYLTVFAGVQRMVNAPSPAAAAHHAVGTAVTVVAATGADVLDWTRSNKPIENYGDAPLDLTPTEMKQVEALRDAVDAAGGTPPETDAAESTDAFLLERATNAWHWLHSTGCGSRASDAFHDAMGTGFMSIETYDILSADNPEFIGLIAKNVMRIPSGDVVMIEEVREAIKQNMVPIDDLVSWILVQELADRDRG